MTDDVKCPRCGSLMRLRKGARGPFYGCSTWPTCTAVVNVSSVPATAKRPDRLAVEPAEFVVFDTETTGVHPTARIVDLALVLVRDGVVVDQVQSLLDPGCPIPPETTAIHGITDAMVRGAPTARDVLPMALELVGTRPVLAHNAAFDLARMRHELSVAGLTGPGAPVFDTLKVARECWPRCRDHKLGTLVEALGLQQREAHRALGDALACCDVWHAARRCWHGLGLATLDPVGRL